MTTIRELIESQSSLQSIIVKPQMLSCMKNQDSILKSIFTKENVQKIINFIIDQQAILKINDNVQGSEVSVAAMEILCCECHIITDLLFATDSQTQGMPLIEKLLGFLTMKQQYVLAAFFSKVIIAITKRVFSPTHKYNKQFCQLIFQKGYLMKTLNHMYSYSMNECILKWFSLKSKGSDPSTKNEYYIHKKNFLLSALRSLNQQTISQFHVDIVTDLFTSLWNQNYKNNQLGEQLLRLVLDLEIVNEILYVVQITDSKTIKFGLLKEFIQRYIDAEKKREENSIQRLIYEIVEAENIEGVFNWCMLCINNYHQNKYRNSKVLLSALQLLFLIQNIQVTKDIILSCYNDNAAQIISSIVKTMKIGNNIIQLAQSKAVNHIISDYKCISFGRRLLFEGIVQLIDDSSSRQHVIAWSEIILNYPSQKQHIFQSEQEEAQFQHVRQIIQNQKSLQVGTCRLSPGYLGFTYSEQKARIQFAKFLNAPQVVVYAGTAKSKKNIEQNSKKQEKVMTEQQKQAETKQQFADGSQKVQSKNQQVIQQPQKIQQSSTQLTSNQIQNPTQIIQNTRQVVIVNEISQAQAVIANEISQAVEQITEPSEVKLPASQHIEPLSKPVEQQITNIQNYKSGYLSYDVSDLMQDL